jgi:radical SAM protein with 4Fe4S-binding SPASM domain
MPKLPSDCLLLPLSQGRLLVSRQQATFCRVAAQDLPAVERALSGGSDLDGEVGALLESHGFFAAARSSEPESHSVQMQLTNACNLACSYCCTNSGQPRRRELTRERWLSLADEIHQAMGPGIRVSLLGGEPFLVPWAIELAEKLDGAGLSVGIFSNGLPLTDESLASRVAGLIRRGANVRVSLAGPSRESCDSLSGAARFDQVIAGLRQLERFGAVANVDLMLTPQQSSIVAAELPRLRALLPKGTPIALGVLFHGGRETGERLFGSRAEFERALDAIAFEAGESIAATPRGKVTWRREGCSCALGHHLHVRSDGALFTCFKMEERVGDLTVESFGAALSRVRSQPHPATSLAFCKDCALATLCGGGCRAENIQFTGDPDVPVCGPWRVRVLAELLAEDQPAALEWPAAQLLREAQLRRIDAPAALVPARPSQHLLDT